MKIKANGIEMNYEFSGKEDGDVVVLGHSLACSLVMWQPQMDELNSRFRVLAVRRPVRAGGSFQQQTAVGLGNCQPVRVDNGGFELVDNHGGPLNSISNLLINAVSASRTSRGSLSCPTS